jgi:hypothetical protein
MLFSSFNAGITTLIIQASPYNWVDFSANYGSSQSFHTSHFTAKRRQVANCPAALSSLVLGIASILADFGFFLVPRSVTNSLNFGQFLLIPALQTFLIRLIDIVVHKNIPMAARTAFEIPHIHTSSNIFRSTILPGARG